VASLSADKSGNRRVQFKGLDGKRHTLYAGKISARAADELKWLVEGILEAADVGVDLSPALAKRLDDLSDDAHAKLVAVGLVNPRAKPEAVTLGPFLDAYIEKRTDLKGGTLVFYGHTIENLKRHFGEECRLDEITAGDADDFRRWLAGDDASRQNPKGKSAKRDSTKPLKRLAVVTVNRRCVAARTIFRDALRRKLITENPFTGIAAGTKSNPERSRYIKRETVTAILEACPDDEWRLLATLSRYAGLRVPSEALPLLWDDVDWAGNRLTVRSPKTEHHAGKAQRIIPLFSEVRECLDRLWAVAADGATLVFSKLQRTAQFSANGWKDVNLRTTFKKIIKRAGAEPWPRIFHNLRASCQTDLEQRFPSYVVCAWLGNSESVAKTHYLQVLPEHFEGAVQGNVNSNVSGVENRGIGMKDESQKHEKTRISAGFSRQDVGDEGFEQPANSSKKQGFPARGNVNSDARPAEDNANGVQTDDRLARLALAWRRLDAAGQDAVVELAETLAGPLDDVGGSAPNCAPSAGRA
jgi:integrase